MSVERELLGIANRAHVQGREIEAATLIRIVRIRLAIAREPTLATLVNDVLIVSRLLNAPQTAEVRSMCRYSDDAVIGAVRRHKSIKAAADSLGCAPRTIVRRMKVLQVDMRMSSRTR